MHATSRTIPFLLLIAAGLTAQDWYVATTGSDGAAGTSAAPFASIGKGVAVAKAGDTVWIKPGTYVPSGIISPANSGTATAPITIRNQGGGQVVIDAQNKVPGYDWDGAVTIGGKSWIIIDGLRVINSHWSGFALNGGSNITIRNCSTYNSNASGIYVAGTDAPKILSNSIQRACQFPLKDPNKGTQECITIGGATNFEVAYNTVFDRMVDVSWGGEGIDCKGSCRNGKVHHNLVYDLIRVGLYIDAYGGDLDGIEIYANTVRNTRHGIIIGNEVNAGVTQNVRVHDNLITNCPNRGISLAGYDGNGPVKNVQIYNNTVHKCGSVGGWEGCGLLVEASNGANTGFVVRNNIFAGNGTQIRANGQSYLTVDRNLVFGSTAMSGSNAIQADPRFVNAGAGDFHLAAGSPAIDAALGTPVSGTDRDDRGRPVDGDGNGSAIADLGAFERAGGSVNQPPTVSASAPANATLGGAVSLGATASDSDGSVAKVEFFAGSTLLGTDTTSPYGLSWTASAAGSYQVTAKATDNLGASATSAAVTITVQPADSGPAGYTYCADENASFVLPGLADVAYGANGKYAYQYGRTGTIVFSNAVFGDPIPGVRKKGYYRLVAAANLVRNPGFEADGAFTQTPGQWTTWTQDGAADANVDFAEGTGGGGGPHGGSWKLCHWRATAWNPVSTYQTVTGLADGPYTLRAWVRCSAGTTAQMYAKRYNAANDAVSKAIPVSGSYQQISISVQVENGQCELGFYSTAPASTGGSFMFVDDVEFVATPPSGAG